CRQDRRLSALQLSAEVPHGFYGDPRAAPDLVVSQLASALGGAAKEQDIGSAAGNRSELQQAEAAQGGLLPGTDGDQQRHHGAPAAAAQTVPRESGTVAEDRKRVGALAEPCSFVGPAGGAAQNDSRRWPDH